MGEKPDKSFKNYVLLVILGVTLFAALQHLNQVAGALGMMIGLIMPLIAGGSIAFILNVPMSFFEKKIEWLQQRHPSKLLRRAKSALSLIVTLVLVVLAVFFVGKVIFPNMAESIRSIAALVSENYQSWIAAAEQYGLDMSGVKKWLMNFDWENLIKQLRDNSGEILSTATQAANSVFGVVANLGFGLIFAIYILLNKRKLGRQARQLAYAYLKKPWADEACDIASLSYRTFAGFLSGQCLEAVILGTMFFITLLIGGFPYAGSISVIIGCMSIIPFVGAFIGMAFGFLLIAVISMEKALWFLVVFFVIQQIEGHIVYPKVVGSSVGLPALWTLLAVVVGGKVSGIFGIIVFIPLFSVIYALVRRNVYSRLRKKNLTIL